MELKIHLVDTVVDTTLQFIQDVINPPVEKWRLAD